MKFAKELEENEVPEWRVKYLNYKQGKKKLKAVGRAVRSVDRSPQKLDQRNTPSLRDGPVYSFLRSRGWGVRSRTEEDIVGLRSELANSVWDRQNDLENATASIPPAEQADERSPLRQRENVGVGSQPYMRRYGSMIGSPPGSTSPALERVTTGRTQASLLELPDPALDPAGNEGRSSEVEFEPHAPPTQMAHTGNAYVIRPATDMQPPSSIRSGLQSAFRLKRARSDPSGPARPALIKRVLSVANGTTSSRASNRDNDVALEAYRELDFRRAEFFHFLDSELDKIESFYKEKEDESKERLQALRQQLHILREMRLHDIEVAERRKRGNHAPNGGARHSREETRGEMIVSDEDPSQSRLPVVEHLQRYKHSVVTQVDEALDKVRTGHVGKTAKAMRDLGTPQNSAIDAHAQDYTRKPQQAVTYRVGKRKLKHAFVEYYRSLDLLKSYTLLNQTAFRKITKKCDKTMPGRAGADYLKNRVNKAYFVTSDVVEVLVL